jgi:hypothetical protein
MIKHTLAAVILGVSALSFAMPANASDVVVTTPSVRVYPHRHVVRYYPRYYSTYPSYYYSYDYPTTYYTYPSTYYSYPYYSSYYYPSYYYPYRSGLSVNYFGGRHHGGRVGVGLHF